MTSTSAKTYGSAVSLASPTELSTSVRTWLVGFAATSVLLFAAQPGPFFTAALALVLMFTMAFCAHQSVQSVNDFDMDQRLVGMVAPAQFACLICLAVQAGNFVSGASLIASSLAAFAAFALIIVIDALLSTLFLFATERKDGISGVSIAALISAKYAGLLGKIQ
jgi:hypothetical protein